jgi:hypothetical protein
MLRPRRRRMEEGYAALAFPGVCFRRTGAKVLGSAGRRRISHIATTKVPASVMRCQCRHLLRKSSGVPAGASYQCRKRV